MGGIFSCCFGSAPRSGSSAGDVYKLDESGRATREVQCAKQWVGRIIGPGGATLAELRRATGASIAVSREPGDPVAVTIAGTPAQVKAAAAAVETLIAEAENPDYEGKAGKKWRAEADRCAQMAEEMAREKDALFDKGDKAGG